MPGFVIDGKEHEVEGWEIQNFLDEAKFKLSDEDEQNRRTEWIRAVCLHTTQGKPATRVAGNGPNAKLDERTQYFWSKSKHSAGAHIIVDCDGSMVCTADLKRTVAYHAGSVNEVTIGIEIAQREMTKPDGKKWWPLYTDQLKLTAKMVLWLCEHFRIAPQYHGCSGNRRYLGHPIARVKSGGKDCVGVYAHRDQTEERGYGDPSDEIYEELDALGFRRFDFTKEEDLNYWKAVQAKLAKLFPDMQIKVDGQAGPKTDRALIRAGITDGVMAILGGKDIQLAV